MSRVICPCGTEMRCLKNSMNTVYESGTIFSGDKFGCECGNEVVLTAIEPLPFDMKPAVPDHDVKMKANQ